MYNCHINRESIHHNKNKYHIRLYKIASALVCACFLVFITTANAENTKPKNQESIQSHINSLIKKYVISAASGKHKLSNQSVAKIFYSEGFSSKLMIYPMGELVGDFEWKPGMGSKFIGPVSGYHDFAPFTDYIPLKKGPILNPNKTYRIGLVYSGKNQPWLVSLADSFVWEAKRHPNVEIKVLDAQFNPSNATHDIESLITQHFDAVVIWPPRAAPLVPAVNRAVQAGMVVVTVDRRVNSKMVTNEVVGNFLANGLQEGLYLNKVTGGHGNVVLIRKTQGSTADYIRTGSFLATIGSGDYKILGSYRGNDQRSVSFKVMTNALQAHPNLNSVFAAGGELGLGSLDAIEQAGRKTAPRPSDHRIVIVDDDDSRQVINAVREGKIAMVSPYTPFLGGLGFRVAVQDIGHKEGLIKKSLPKEIITPNLPMVTQESMVIDGIHTVTPDEWPYAYGPTAAASGGK